MTASSYNCSHDKAQSDSWRNCSYLSTLKQECDNRDEQSPLEADGMFWFSNLTKSCKQENIVSHIDGVLTFEEGCGQVSAIELQHDELFHQGAVKETESE